MHAHIRQTQTRTHAQGKHFCSDRMLMKRGVKAKRAAERRWRARGGAANLVEAIHRVVKWLFEDYVG